jgi:hypothetical protein
MSASSKPAVESLGIVKGHYECNFLDETVPVLSQLLALKVVDRQDKEVTMKHPNTDWLLVVHEADQTCRTSRFATTTECG